MKKIFLALLLITNFSVFAQKPCEIDTEVKDSLGTFKSTKQYQVFERNFAGNATNIFFSLASNNGLFSLDMQMIQHSNDFIKAMCFDTNTKIYLQLNNGKIFSLLYVGEGSCGTLLRDDKGGNNRILSGSFVFSKENFEDLKVSPVTFMRVKFGTEIVDYPFKTEFTSELDKKTYQPENYFIDYLKCIID